MPPCHPTHIFGFVVAVALGPQRALTFGDMLGAVLPENVPPIGELCEEKAGCVPSLVFLDDDLIHLESAASHATIRPGKVYVPAWTTERACRVYELDVSTTPVSKRVVVPEITLLAPDPDQGSQLKPFGSRVANDGILFITDLVHGWTVGIDVDTGETVTQVRTCAPNDFDFIQSPDGSDITLLMGGGYRFSSWGEPGNAWCFSSTASTYGNIIKVPIKKDGKYLCGKAAQKDDGRTDRCSWKNFGEYAENTNSLSETYRWTVLGQGTYRGGVSMNGPLAGLAVAADGTIWSTHLNSIVKTDPNSGKATADIRAKNWYGEFESEYSGKGIFYDSSHPYGAIDNARMLADGTSMLVAIYEAFCCDSNIASLAEQYSFPRKFKTKYAHVVATSFCTDKWRKGMSPTQVSGISKIFKFDPSSLDMPDKYCIKVDPDDKDAPPFKEKVVYMPCFSGRNTHVQPVEPTDALVAVNYQSKAVLVMQHANLARLQCNSWAK